MCGFQPDFTPGAEAARRHWHNPCSHSVRTCHQPLGEEAEMLNHAHVRLSWEATSGATSYRIYRSDIPHGIFNLLSETQELFYDDHHQSGDENSYYYLVTGVNPCGAEGL